jgi:hypothetical protein
MIKTVIVFSSWTTIDLTLDSMSVSVADSVANV